MKKIPINILIIVLFVACAEEFIPNNPGDPGNPLYVRPEVEITSGPDEGTIDTTITVTFHWHDTDSVARYRSENELITTYRYKLDTQKWSDWSGDTSATFSYLDEEDHLFSVQSKYSSGDTSNIVSRAFITDAVKGPALMFYPRRNLTVKDDTITFKILAEEVSNLTATEFSIIFDPSLIRVISISQGSMLRISVESIFHAEYDNGQGQISILTVALGGENPSVEGTGDLAELELHVLRNGDGTLEFDGSEVFRDPNNISINILETVEGYVKAN